MTFAVLVEPQDDRFAAWLVGAPELRVLGATRDQAIASLRSEISQRVRRGELLSLEIDVGPLGVASLAGSCATDPTLQEICADAYLQRDAAMHE